MEGEHAALEQLGSDLMAAARLWTLAYNNALDRGLGGLIQAANIEKPSLT